MNFRRPCCCCCSDLAGGSSEDEGDEPLAGRAAKQGTLDAFFKEGAAGKQAQPRAAAKSQPAAAVAAKPKPKPTGI